MTTRCCLVAIVVITCLPFAATAQRSAPREAHIIYNNGFVVKGTVNEKVGTVIWDRASGRPFSIPSGEFFLDDQVRRVLFTPGQIQKVLEYKAPPGAKPPMMVKRFEFFFKGKTVQPTWLVERMPAWNDKGERQVRVRGPNFAIDMHQQIALVTPQVMRAFTKAYDWDLWYFTSEMGPELSRDILFELFTEAKDFKKLKDAEKLLRAATFMEDAGWYAQAEKELTRVVDSFPVERRQAQDRLDKMKRLRAGLYVEGIKKASEEGQHETAIDRLKFYEKQEMLALVTPEQRLIAQDLKVKYDKSKADIEQAKEHLKTLPILTRAPKTWSKATAFIAEELNHDTIEKLDAFLAFAQQYESDRKQKRDPAQSAEQVLAFAITGWLQGKSASEPDAAIALKLTKVREAILAALASDDPRACESVASALKEDGPLPLDVLVRLVRLLPPPAPHDAAKLGGETQTVQIAVPNGVDGSYLLKLPPDYHHQRSYPVLLLMPGALAKPEEMLAKFADDAAKNGYILAAPLPKGKTYGYSALEHALVLDTMRDLRRRFQVDSDRVFLFGWEEGANMAFDVGLAHPDQFAGVMVMNGTVTPFARFHYWPNAQYLPFYVIEGDRNASNAKLLRDLFNAWNREPYGATYVEYKGRGTEWYGAEVPILMQWMQGKKRYYPRKDLGRAGGTVRTSEEFHSTRPGDSRFYWLTGEGMSPNCLADHQVARWPGAFRAATLTAHLSIGNLKDSIGAAKIWNQLNVQVHGYKHVTIGFTPGMMDFTKPLRLRVNSNEIESKKMVEPNLETLLEELYQTSDRQRLIIAKIGVRL